MKSKLANFLRNTYAEKGVTMIEYALIAAVVAVALLATLTALEGGIDAAFQKVINALK